MIRHAMAKNVTLPKDLTLQLENSSFKENSSFNEFICESYDIITKTPMTGYWLSFMEMMEILVMNIHGLKTKYWIQFKQSIRLVILLVADL